MLRTTDPDGKKTFKLYEWREMLCSRIGRLKLVKMPVSPQVDI